MNKSQQASKNENKNIPHCGEIWLVKFKKSKEAPKTYRPCLVISGDIQNEFNDLIAVVPITTNNIEIIEPFEVLIENTPETGLKKPSKIQFIFPMTIDKELRLVDQQRIGIASKEGLTELAQKAWQIAFDSDNWNW